MAENVQALVMTVAQTAMLGAAFRCWHYRQWLGWVVGMIALTLAYIDGHYYWGHHDLLVPWE